MQSISVHAEREYDVRFVDNWQTALTEIAQSHEKVLVIAPSELVAAFNLGAIQNPAVQVVSTPIGEAAKSPDYLDAFKI